MILKGFEDKERLGVLGGFARLAGPKCIQMETPSFHGWLSGKSPPLPEAAAQVCCCPLQQRQHPAISRANTFFCSSLWKTEVFQRGGLMDESGGQMALQGESI